MNNPSQLPAHRVLVEPDLAFHPDRQEDRSPHPLQGLVDFGPYSRSLVNNVLDPIRVGAILPRGGMRVVDGLLREIESRHAPRERYNYLIKFPGFSRIFGLRVVKASDSIVELPGEVEAEISGSGRPHIALSEAMVRALGALKQRRHQFDVVLIYLPEHWSQCFYGTDGEDFDLHDYVKAVSAVHGIPVQIVLDSALNYGCRCSVMWRLGIALYCKAGGVPWKLADSEPDTAFVGLSYALKMNADGSPTFVTCCSQVFDADGAGLEFIVYETSAFHVERENPFLERGEMRRVMARSLALYQRRHSGRKPRRIVVHKSTRFTDDEVEGCFDGWQGVESVELIQVQQDSPWRGVELRQPKRAGEKSVASRYPCERGTHLQLGGRETLLWTQGNAPRAVGGDNFYKEGKGIPAPLQLIRFAGHGGWDAGCRDILGLSKMDWNNDSLYDRLPVTMSYAQVLARTVKRMPVLGSQPYEFRFFM